MKPRANAADRPTVLTVERGLRVLREFKSDRPALSNSELVRRTGLSKATVSRLTTTLMQLGFLRHVRDSREFELGTASLGVGQAFLAASDLLRIANPFLQELADRLDVSVALADRSGLDMLYIGYRASRKVATLRLGIGSVLPMGSTAIGHAYMWGLTAERRQQLVANIKREASTGASVLGKSMRKSFAELKATGTCAVLGGYQRDAYAVALPVIIGRDRIVMGLSCGKADIKPDLAAERERMAPVLIKAAREFEQLLADFAGPA